MTDPYLPGALEGVRVVEFAQAMAIPAAGLLLADMGADVIKVEPPAGDAFRHTMEPIVPGEAKGYALLNRGKRSICLDVTRPEARPAIEALARWADIVLMSFKPTDLPRYGIAYEDFRVVNPRIVYLEHAPVGNRGPMVRRSGLRRHRPGHLGHCRHHRPHAWQRANQHPARL